MSNAAKLKKRAAELELKKHYDKAVALYVQVLDETHEALDDADVSLYNRVGDLLLRTGAAAEALTYYEKAVDVYAERGFLNNAIALCNKILRQSPGRSAIYYKLGKISAAKGFKSDAKKNFLEYADRMRREGHMSEAFRALKEFADLCPDQDDIRLMLAEQLSREGRKDEALEQLQLLYERLMQDGRTTEARATIDRMRALNPDAVPREATAQAAAKPAELVFIDLEFEQPRTESSSGEQPRVATPAATRPVTPRAPIARVATPPAAAALDATAQAPTLAPESASGDAPAVRPPVPRRSDPLPLLDLDTSSEPSLLPDLTSDEHLAVEEAFAIQPSDVAPVDEEETLGDELTFLEEPPLSGSDFAELPLADSGSRRAIRAHDLALPGELPVLTEPLDAGDAPASDEGPLDALIAPRRNTSEFDLLETLTPPIARHSSGRHTTVAEPPAEDLAPAAPDFTFIDLGPDAGVDHTASLDPDVPLDTPLDARSQPVDGGDETTAEERPELGDLGLDLDAATALPDLGDVAFDGAAPEHPAPSFRVAPEGAETQGAVETEEAAACVPSGDVELAAHEEESDLEAAPPATAPTSRVALDEIPKVSEDSPVAEDSLVIDDSLTSADLSPPDPLAAAEGLDDFELPPSEVDELLGAAPSEPTTADAPPTDESILSGLELALDAPAESHPAAATLEDDAQAPEPVDESPAEVTQVPAAADAVLAAPHVDEPAANAEPVPPVDTAAPEVAAPAAIEAAEEAETISLDSFTENEIVVEDDVVEEILVEDAPVEETIIEDTIVEDTLVKDTIVEDTIVQDASVEHEIVDDEIVEDEIVDGARGDEGVEAAAGEESVGAPAVIQDGVDFHAALDGATATDAPAVVEHAEAVDEATVLEQRLLAQSLLEQPVVEQPVLEEPVLEQPAHEEITVEERLADAPQLDESSREDPAAAAPAWDHTLAIADKVIADEVIAEAGTPGATVAEEPEVAPPPRTESFTPMRPASLVEMLRERVASTPDDWQLRRELGEALLDGGWRAEGLAELEQAMLGLEADADLEGAQGVVDEIVALAPSSVRYHQKRVEYAFRLNDVTRLVEAYLDLADTLFRSGEAEKAAAVYRRVLELAPDNARARTGMATLEYVPVEVHAGAGGGVATAPPAVDYGPPSGDAPEDESFIDLGEWLRAEEEPRSTRMVVEAPAPTGDERSDFAEMLKKFKRGVAENVDDEDYESHYDLGVAYKEMGLLDEAIAEFQRALRGTGQSVRSYEALGQCFVEKSQFQVAITVLSRALTSQDDHQLVGVLYLLGYAHEALGRWSDALQYYRRVVAVDILFRDIGDRIAAVERMTQ